MNISHFTNTSSELGDDWQFFYLRTMDTTQHWRIIQMTFILLTLLYTLIADGFIIPLIFSNSELRITANVFIATYLMSDIAQIMIYSVSSFIGLIQGGFWLNQKMCTFQSGAITTFRAFSFILLVLMSLEKMMYIIYPFKHQRFFRKRNAFCYLVVLFCLNVVFMAMSAILQTAMFDVGILCCEPKWDPNMRSQLITTLVVIIQVLVITVCQVMILIFAIKHNIKIRRQTANFHEDRITSEMLKRAFSLVLVILLYGSSRSSYYLMRFFPENLIGRRIVIYFLTNITPVLNSIIFVMQNRPMKQTLASRFGRNSTGVKDNIQQVTMH